LIVREVARLFAFDPATLLFLVLMFLRLCPIGTDCILVDGGMMKA
jgi:hypothetical protein